MSKSFEGAVWSVACAHSSSRRAGQSRPTRRRGSALLLVLIAIVVLSVLSTGAIMGSLEELRSAKNLQMEQRALTVAEFGLNQQLANWTSTRAALANGAIDSSKVSVGAGDTAFVSVMRLNTRNFWVVSTGRTNGGKGRLEAQRQVSLLVNLNTATVSAPAVVTSYGATDIKGSANITGINTPPSGWLGCPAAPDTFAVAVNPSQSVSIQKPSSQSVNGSTNSDPRTGQLTTYTTFGTETWASLVAKANVTTSGASPSPTGTSTTCSYSSTNWGEPYRTGGYVSGCTSYFPIIYSAGAISINGGRGQGVLIVNGDFTTNGNFYFAGLVLVAGNLKANGNMEIDGAIMTQGTTDILGNATFNYSSCALTNAVAGLATPTRTKQRSWAQLF